MIDGVRLRIHAQPDDSQMRFRVHVITHDRYYSRPNKPLEYENWPISKHELGVLQMQEGLR